MAAVRALVHQAGASTHHLEMLGSLKELEALSGRKLEQLPARLRGLRFLFQRIRDANVMDAGSLTTLKSQTETAIGFAASVDPAIGKPVPLTSAWEALIDRLQVGRSRSVLMPFAQYCSTWAITPATS